MRDGFVQFALFRSFEQLRAHRIRGLFVGPAQDIRDALVRQGQAVGFR